MTNPRILPLFLCLLLAVSCSHYKRGGESYSEADHSNMAVPPAPGQRVTEVANGIYKEPRQLIHTASLNVEVKALDEAYAAVERMAQDTGGYVERSKAEDRFAYLTLRIPVEHRLTALDTCRGLGKVLHEEMQSVEVTDQVIDLRAQLETQIALRGRLQTLLERAANVNEVLTIEKEIQRLQASIDAHQGRLDTMLDRVALTQIDLELRQYIEPEEKPRRILGPVGMVLYGAGWLIEKAFVIRE